MRAAVSRPNLGGRVFQVFHMVNQWAHFGETKQGFSFLGYAAAGGTHAPYHYNFFPAVVLYNTLQQYFASIASTTNQLGGGMPFRWRFLNQHKKTNAAVIR